MQILSHRGYWTEKAEQNTLAAFERSFSLGCGIETDIRDLDGSLVISHDPPLTGALPFTNLCEMYKSVAKGLPLALNVKSSGLQNMVLDTLTSHGIENYFCFDMAVPDMLGYMARGLNTFTRISDVEEGAARLDAAQGVWVDALEREWIGQENIVDLLSSGKIVCLVSPELHSRPHIPVWTQIRSSGLNREARMMICTDWPVEACSFFTR